jgi:sec-independent protein translocase protein TatA
MLRAAAFAQSPPEVIAMFGLGTYDLIIVAVVVLLLFGNRLPSVMRSLGRGVVEFKKGVRGIEEEVDTAGGDVKKPM